MERAHSILVVDDIEDNRELIRQVLECEPYKVFLAENATVAKEIINQTQLDLLILDVHMPETDGFELCRWLREAVSAAALPVIFVTAVCTSVEHVIAGLDIGAVDYLTKPFEADELRARVRTILRLQDAHQEQTKQVKRMTARLYRAFK